MYKNPRSLTSVFPPRQKGAVGIFFAIILGSALLCTVLAVDAGRLYWEGQELQRLADIAALDAVTGIQLPSDTAGTPDDLANAENLAIASIERNLSEKWSTPTTNVRQREIVTLDGVRQLCNSANCDSYAIQVELTRETCSSIILNIAALFGRGSSNNTNGLCYEPMNLVRSAVAALPPQYVSFSASSTLLRLCSSEAPASQPLLQPLMQLLSSEELCVALISSEGIVDANISLLELREGMALLDTDASLGTLDDLLSSDLNIGNLIDIFLAAANSDSEHLALLDLNESLSAAILNSPLQLGDILQLGSCQWSGGSVGNSCNQEKTLAAALSSEIDMRSLLESAILLANSDNAIDITTDLNLGGLVRLNDLSLTIIQPPKMAIGPVGCANGEAPAPGCSRWQTEAQPAQIELSTGLAVGLPNLLSLNLDINSTLVGADVGISKMERTGNLVDDIPEYTLYAGANLKPVKLNISGNLSLPDLGLGNLLTKLDELPLLGPILDGLLGGLSDLLTGIIPILGGPTETLLSIEQTGPVTLPIAELTATITAESEEVAIDWPSDTQGTIVATRLSGVRLSRDVNSVLDSDIPLESETKIQKCYLNLLLIEICEKPTYKTASLATPLESLLLTTIDLQQQLITVISGPVLQLLGALGVGVNETDVEILEINAGTAAALI